MNGVLAVIIFVAAYIFIATEKINKTIVAVLGACAMLFLHLVSFEQAMEMVDFNVIFLLIGMMMSVSILSKTGFFEWAAISVAKLAKGKPITIMLWLLVLTAVFSAFLDNVTTIILLVPMTILIAQILEVSPIPFVVMEAISSNLGGTATLIGDPPNIIIGSQAHLSFNDFLLNLGPAIFVVLAIFIVSAWFLFRNRLGVEDNIRKRVTEAEPALAIVDKKNMIRALIILGGILAGFLLHSVTNIEPGVIALCGGMLMVLVCNAETDHILLRVEWGVVFFFIGLFIMISALEVNGIIELLAKGILSIAGGNLFLMCILVLWGSAIISAVLDNIPFTITMVPLLKLCFAPIAASMQIHDPAVIQTQIAEPLWWALAMGACLGGNGTLIGASANVVMAHICSKNKYPVGFMFFSKYGFAFMVQSILICSLYLWIRYF